MPERTVGSPQAHPAAAAAFPGATAITVLDVYDWVAPDGLPGGSAHVHLASTEGYVVASGAGRLQTLGERGYAETALRPGDCLWFTPGTIHRLVNEGDLRLFVVMQNAGLPEHGDAVLRSRRRSSPTRAPTRAPRRCPARVRTARRARSGPGSAATWPSQGSAS